MKLYRKNKLVRVQSVHGVPCGIRIDEVRLDAEDFDELRKMPKDAYSVWLEHWSVRFTRWDDK